MRDTVFNAPVHAMWGSVLSSPEIPNFKGP
jgi:hypothetical protein